MKKTRKPKAAQILTALAKAWAHWCPPPRMTIAEWAEAHRVLARGTTSEPGKYRCDRVPYQREPMEQITSPEVRETVLCWGSQLGKTMILENTIGYFIACEPSPILVKYPGLGDAKGFSKEKFSPMVAATPELSSRIQDARTRDSGNTIETKLFPGGFIAFVGANSPSSLRRRSCRVIIQDEIDTDTLSAGDEGDPVALADRRSVNFSNAVKVKSSTPTIAGRSRIWSLLEQSDWRTWRVKCPHCQHEQELRWEQMKWDTDAEGKLLPESCRYECEECGQAWTDLQRKRAIMAGRWVPRQPFSGVRGYHLSALYRVMGEKPQFVSQLHEFVVDFLTAKRGGPESLKQWKNTFLSEPFEEETAEKISVEDAQKRIENYDTKDAIPASITKITAGVDVQGDRIECEVVGWSAEEESWGLGYHVCHGDTEREEPWRELAKLLVEIWTREDGVRLKIETMFVDSGHKQERVFDFTGVRRSRGVFAVKGVNSPGLPSPILPRKYSINNKRKIPQWMIGVTAAKTAIFDRLLQPSGGARTMHYPQGSGYDERYFAQLTTERRRTKFVKGRPVVVWEANNRRNEPLDCRVYALAAFRRTPPTFSGPEVEEPEKGEIEVVEGVPLSPPPPPPTQAKKPAYVPRWKQMQEQADPTITPIFRA